VVWLVGSDGEGGGLGGGGEALLFVAAGLRALFEMLLA
jgi:hypothetical protein